MSFSREATNGSSHPIHTLLGVFYFEASRAIAALNRFEFASLRQEGKLERATPTYVEMVDIAFGPGSCRSDLYCLFVQSKLGHGGNFDGPKHLESGTD